MGGKARITGRCTVCRHPDRGRIDWLAATGQPLLPLAEQFGLNHHALRRHFKNHVTDGFKKSAQVGPFQSEERLRSLCADAGTSVIENLRSIHAGLASRWLRAIESGNDQAVVGLSKAMHENLAMQGRITRELMPAPASVTVNAFLTGDWLADFSRELLELVRIHPQVRPDLIALLRRRMGGQDTQLIEGEAMHHDAA